MEYKRITDKVNVNRGSEGISESDGQPGHRFAGGQADVEVVEAESVFHSGRQDGLAGQTLRDCSPLCSRVGCLPSGFTGNESKALVRFSSWSDARPSRCRSPPGCRLRSRGCFRSPPTGSRSPRGGRNPRGRVSSGRLSGISRCKTGGALRELEWIVGVAMRCRAWRPWRCRRRRSSARPPCPTSSQFVVWVRTRTPLLKAGRSR